MKKTITWSALAEKLGYTARSLRAWRQVKGAPRKPVAAEWLAFIEARGLGLSGGKRLDTLRDCRIEEVKLKCEKLRRELALASNTAISRSDFDTLLGFLARDTRNAIYAGVDSTLPPLLDGLPASEIRAKLREWADALMDHMADSITRFEAEHPEA